MFIIWIFLTHISSCVNFFDTGFNIDVPLEKNYRKAQSREGNSLYNFLADLGEKGVGIKNRGKIMYYTLTGQKSKVDTMQEPKKHCHKTRIAKKSHILGQSQPPDNNVCGVYGFYYESGKICVCNPQYVKAYLSMGLDGSIKCNNLRKTHCRFIMVSPQSQCPDVDRRTNPTSYCIKAEDNEVKTVEFNMKCTWDAAPEFQLLGQNAYPQLDDTATNDKFVIRDSNNNVILLLDDDFSLNVQMNIYDFNTMKDSKINLYNETIEALDLNYTINKDGEAENFNHTFNFKLNLTKKVLDYVVTNRLSVELTAEIESENEEKKEELEKELDVVPTWWSIDFPSKKLPRYKLRPLTSFEIVVIILGVLAGIIIIAFVCSIIYEYYGDYRDYQDELEKERKEKERKRKRKAELDEEKKEKENNKVERMKSEEKEIEMTFQNQDN